MSDKDSPVSILQEKLTAVGINKSVADVIGCKFVFATFDHQVFVAGTIKSINSDADITNVNVLGLRLLISTSKVRHHNVSCITLLKGGKVCRLDTNGPTDFIGTLILL